MPNARDFVTTFTIKTNGQPLAGDDALRLTAVTVEQNLHLPDACTITFRDATFSLTDRNILPIGSEIEVLLGQSEEQAQRVFKGEVIAQDLDVVYQSSPTLVVRAYDRMHRLQRGRQSRSFLQVTDSDIATKIAQESGLQAQVDSTSQVYDYVLQNDQTNLEFLQERANHVGYEVWVDDTTLHFRKPRPDAGAALDAELWAQVSSVRVHMTSVAQVNDVKVRGWDPSAKQAILGQANQGAATARGGQQQHGSQLASPFGSASMIVTAQPVQNQAEADTLAQALADDLAGTAIYLEAEMFGDPDVRPGKVVNLKSLGQRFSGQYYVTSAKHYTTPTQGYTTAFTVNGRRNGSLLELVSGNGKHNGRGHGANGAITIGVVTNNKDPQNLGRVKVKLPWIADSEETDWARIVTPSGGNGRGFYWLPEVNDEVLVAFEHGETRRPFVLGALWNNQDSPPKGNSEVVGGDGVTQRIMKSRSGHTITLDDTSGSESITIADKSGNNVITIETSSNKITLKAQGDLELNAQGDVKVSGMNVQVQAQSDCQFKATGEAQLSGATVGVQAQGTCNIQGAMINLN